MAVRYLGGDYIPENQSPNHPREPYQDKEEAEHIDLCSRMENLALELRVIGADTAADYVSTALRDYEHWYILHF